MSLPAVGLPRGCTGRQSPDVPKKTCLKAANREKLPKADGSKTLGLRRHSLTPISTPVNRPVADKAAVSCTPKLSGLEFLHQKHPGKTGLSRPTLQNVCALPIGGQVSKRSKIANEPLSGQTKSDRRQTPDRLSRVLGPIVHDSTNDVLCSSDEDEQYRKCMTDESCSNGLSQRQKCLSELHTEDDKYGRTKLSHKGFEPMHYQQALLGQIMGPNDPEDCNDLKSMTRKKSDKKTNKKGKDKRRANQSPCPPLSEPGHKYEDLPLLRQTRLRVSMDPDAAVPDEAQYVPTPPGYDKIPCRPMSSKGAATSPAPRQVRFNTEERGIH